jgi:predicted enzyme related to lactoylglutathione lyase
MTKENTMTTPAPGTLAWFEVAAADPDAAELFYGKLFDWTFAPDPVSAGIGLDYRITTGPTVDTPMGGVTKAQDGMPNHAVFYILVADVAATCATAVELGGSVVAKEESPPAGPAFAYLRDPAGSMFGVFTPPPG